MKILFLTYDLPYPLDQGGRIRAYHLIKGLARSHQITLFSFIRCKEQRRYLSQLKPFCQKILLFQRIKAFSPHHFLTTLKSGLPFPIALYQSGQLEKSLQKAIKSKVYDLIHFESFYTSGYLKKSYLIPQILGTENIESQIYQQYSQAQRWPFSRGPMAFESWRIKRFEKRTWRQADACLAVSSENRQEIKSISGKKCYLIPNGIDLDFFKFQLPSQRAQRPAIILYVGNFRYIQNQDAAYYLAKKVFPLIKKQLPGVRLLIVGRCPTRKIKGLVSDNIVLKPNLDDIRQAYAQADLLLAPIRAGSGTKFKILEAMASGVPVITTPLGIEGIKAKNGHEVMIGKTAGQLSKLAIKLLCNLHLCQKLSKKSRYLVEQIYGWQKISLELEKAYQEIINA